MNAICIMEAGKTYSIREVAPDGTTTPKFTLRTVSPDPSIISGDWVLTDVATGNSQTCDVGDAWLHLTRASDSDSKEIGVCVCAWCFPLNPFSKPGGESHSICDHHQHQLFKEVNAMRRGR